jgi:predicted outer membrane lipoprotein
MGWAQSAFFGVVFAAAFSVPTALVMEAQRHDSLYKRRDMTADKDSICRFVPTNLHM